MTDDTGLVPVSRAQLAAWDARVQPAVEQVAPDVWAIPVPIPAGTIPHTLSYALVADDGVHLIDPGWDAPESLDALASGLAVIDRTLDDVRTVIATHFHPDHLGAADALRRTVGARVVFSGVEDAVLQQETAPEAYDSAVYRAQLREWGVPADRWDELLASFDRPALVAPAGPDDAVADGDVLELSGHRLRVIATPGHTDGHICLVDDERRLLYSGDHVLPRIFPGVGIGVLPGADPLADYFDSLDLLAPYDEHTVLPGHEYGFRGLGARRAQLIGHHLRRTTELAALLEEDAGRTVWEYARRLTWTAGWEGMTGFWLHSALRQTELHRDYATNPRSRARIDAHRAERAQRR
ncbi:MBL fold metallo-hydrolase [Microbacterium sp.]|uniref:MBL fold metallo-hydrolase n=1 Tax=Microbacterium sp. TaxID=51671 RepID=UPI0028B15A37|nr:MBL fold metallo-hydrolase [Microbacterium sp.]